MVQDQRTEKRGCGGKIKVGNVQNQKFIAGKYSLKYSNKEKFVIPPIILHWLKWIVKLKENPKIQ